ncbi:MULTISPECIES: MAPEG family protein [Shewanella]|uniref:MAPEG family protein n=1 Tax=Shewanella sedimentimangrovi TaxID=2814293 RepID=A0ABX7R028_9GAMM|nr:MULTISPECIES: MAPEG family protein [Shewanella]QSX36450.1 MAPEG family protein [Shewanella sedimentimangrovi]QSX40057.1 MAPEG family protein [Shewanella cyperi]
MTTLLACLLLAMLLPYLAKAPVALAMAKLGGYDNHHPRSQQARLEGFGARALAAHQNAFESLLIFGLAVLAVLATDSANGIAEGAAVVHIVARLGYQLAYLYDKDKLRSSLWFVGIIASFTILAQAL